VPQRVDQTPVSAPRADGVPPPPPSTRRGGLGTSLSFEDEDFDTPTFQRRAQQPAHD
jgi:hypothetical protein